MSTPAPAYLLQPAQLHPLVANPAHSNIFQLSKSQQNAVTERCKLTEGQSPVVPCPSCKTRKEAPSSGGGRSAQTRRLQRQEPGHLLGTAQSQGPEPLKT